MPAQKPSLKARALRYLSAREHSRQELGRKLARHAEEGDDVEAVLEWLKTNNFLSDERFAESLVNRRANRFGGSRILAELNQHGLGEVIVAGLREELAAGESDRAWQVWQKKFQAPAADAAQAAKQMRFLQQRGFSHEAIKAVMRRAKEAC